MVSGVKHGGVSISECPLCCVARLAPFGTHTQEQHATQVRIKRSRLKGVMIHVLCPELYPLWRPWLRWSSLMRPLSSFRALPHPRCMRSWARWALLHAHRNSKSTIPMHARAHLRRRISASESRRYLHVHAMPLMHSSLYVNKRMVNGCQTESQARKSSPSNSGSACLCGHSLLDSSMRQGTPLDSTPRSSERP